MFDATGHGANCAYAADPRNKCDCGGKKKTDMRNHFAPGNDDSGLAAMAGDMPQQVVALERKISTVQQQLAANKDRAITMMADATFGAGNWKREGLRGAIHPGGREVYSYQGRAFIEFLPVDFQAREFEDRFETHVIQQWQKPEPQP